MTIKSIKKFMKFFKSSPFTLHFSTSEVRSELMYPEKNLCLYQSMLKSFGGRATDEKKTVIKTLKEVDILLPSEFSIPKDVRIVLSKGENFTNPFYSELSLFRINKNLIQRFDREIKTLF